MTSALAATCVATVRTAWRARWNATLPAALADSIPAAVQRAVSAGADPGDVERSAELIATFADVFATTSRQVRGVSPSPSAATVAALDAFVGAATGQDVDALARDVAAKAQAPAAPEPGVPVTGGVLPVDAVGLVKQVLGATVIDTSDGA